MRQTFLYATLLALITSFIQPENSGKVYLSLDQGKHWKRADNGLPQNATINDLSKVNESILAVTDAHGVFVSNDHLQSWHPSNTGLPKKIKIDASLVYEHKIYLGSNQQGIFVSDDQARNWYRSNNGLRDLTIRVLYGYGSKLLAGTNQGLYQSADKGKSWSLISPQYQINGITSVNQWLYLATNKGVVLSTDGANSWKIIYDKSAVHNISSHKAFVYAMTYGEGLVRAIPSENQNQWKKVNKGLPALYTFQVKSTNTVLLAGQWDGIYTSENNGESWQKSSWGLEDGTSYKELLITDLGIIAGAGMKK